ncbi:hypothetical protein B7C51_09110 [Paenibacillus larvae subsp. pulvifaciens]|uniref:Insertion element IS150 protein InsJ-like helix-turn-helix domain-containing protein n=2 Tax=Paenibacillus larvae TaxID=1464 RepID=A0A1V0US52_9BACL|nr:hypothetical protein B7C51_09110 [Paenibacillus larvae subsp. pulvifaciens]
MYRSMTKGRPTTWEERIQIVLYCLENAKDFQLAAQTYGVSYQQVYQWVQKYEDGGDEALGDKRGRNKAETELSPDFYLNQWERPKAETVPENFIG